MCKTYKQLILCLLTIGVFAGVPAFGLSATFDQNLVMSDSDLYSLPLAYSSAEKIQQYLESLGSMLATTRVQLSFVPGSGVVQPSAYAQKPAQFNTANNYNTYRDQTVLFSDFIWRLARTNMTSSCGLNWIGNGNYLANDICYDAGANPINPGFLLAVVQKESGLVYGRNSKVDPNSDYGRFLLERIIGYYCFETSDRTRSCYDENPNWQYYKGVFRQLFYGVRLLRLRELTCKVGGAFAFRSSAGIFSVGNTVTIDGQPVTLRNGITCAMYIYTPHVSAQRLTWAIMKDMGADRNYIEQSGVDNNYRPILFTPIR